MNTSRIEKIKIFVRSNLVLVLILSLVFIGGGGATALFLGGGGSGTSGSGSVRLNKGLVGHWKMNGDAKDSTPNGNDGTLNGDTSLTTDRKGQSDSAFTFDGTGDDIDVGSSILSSEQSWTMSFWFLSRTSDTSPTSGEAHVISIGDSGAGTRTMATWRGENISLFAHDGTDGFDIRPDSNLNADTWYHATIVRDGDTATVFIDGSSEGSETDSAVGDTINSQNTLIGGAQSNEHYFNGKVDDVRIYDRALSKAEVSALANSYNTQASSGTNIKGMQGHWKFDGGAKDSTPNGNDGSITGNASSTTDREGQADSAFTFDGTDSGIDIGDTLIDGWSEVTISAWINTDTTYTQDINCHSDSDPSSVGIIADKSGGSSDDNISFCIESTDQLTFYLDNGSDRVATSSTAISTSTWVHVAATYDGSDMKLYIDGTLDKTTSAGSSNLITNTNTLSIGKRGDGGGHFNGKIDDVRIYDRALSQEEIQRQANSYNPKLSSGSLVKDLKAHWAMDGGAKDSTPHGNDGTLNGDTSLTTDRKGNSDSAFDFDGSGDYIDISNPNFPTGTSPRTISGWFNPSSSDSQKFLNYGQSTEVSGKRVSITAGTSTVAVAIANCNYGNDSLSLSGWNHIAVVFPSSGSVCSDFKIYLNGVEQTLSTLAGSGSQSVDTASDLAAIGGQGGVAESTGSYNGKIDDVRIYNRALSDAEIKQLFEMYR